MEAYQPSIKTSKLQLDSSEKKKNSDENLEGCAGILDVYVHQARDIQNICIYQNQDVYAKLWLTSDPNQKVSTQIIDHGGRDPVFNENVQFSVRTIDSMLRCEVWMLSRIKNYLEDQLLGFTIVPLSAILIENGKLSKEFSLSSSDLFHSPAGFVELTLKYNGVSPEVIETPRQICSFVADSIDKDSGLEDATSNQLDNIEFPDLGILEEHECMASEYFAIPCLDLESKRPDQCGSTEIFGDISPYSHVSAQENVDADDQVTNATKVPFQMNSAAKSSSSVSVPANILPVSDSSRNPESQKQDDVSDSNEETASEVEEKVKSMPRDFGTLASSVSRPVINITAKPGENIIEQEIIDTYMKSLNQFTEALAKMKLPMDIKNVSSIKDGSGNLVKSGCTEKPDASMDSTEPSPKVFYGSRAFF